jgi:hypothetical protein
MLLMNKAAYLKTALDADYPGNQGAPRIPEGEGAAAARFGGSRSCGAYRATRFSRPPVS